jgi:hypothetical protein
MTAEPAPQTVRAGLILCPRRPPLVIAEAPDFPADVAVIDRESASCPGVTLKYSDSRWSRPAPADVPGLRPAAKLESQGIDMRTIEAEVGQS